MPPSAAAKFGTSHRPAITPTITLGTAPMISIAGLTQRRSPADMNQALYMATTNARGVAKSMAQAAAFSVPTASGTRLYLPAAKLSPAGVDCHTHAGDG
ncbi:hypothetical protein [Sodalis glossinidius]|uniref:hypothetical protein n=1 Tax=Sodalis glossinidius TaxID=63612 RepID=UPI0009FE108A|nr:hypothetical protein [Sodalis glossinidius]